MILTQLNVGLLVKQLKQLVKDIPEASVVHSSTGSIYVVAKGKKIRISDHEPNWAMTFLRGKPDHEIYTHDVAGVQVSDNESIIGNVSEVLDVEAKGTLKTYIKKQWTLKERVIKERMERKKELEIYTKQSEAIKERMNVLIINAVKANLSLMDGIIKESNVYGMQNPKKRAERERTKFKQLMLEKYGIEASRGDVKDALNDAGIKVDWLQS